MAKMYCNTKVHEPTYKGTSMGKKPITSTMNKTNVGRLKNTEDKVMSNLDECLKLISTREGGCESS